MECDSTSSDVAIRLLAGDDDEVMSLSSNDVYTLLQQLDDALNEYLDGKQRVRIAVWMPRCIEAALFLLLASTSSHNDVKFHGFIPSKRIDLIVAPTVDVSELMTLLMSINECQYIFTTSSMMNEHSDAFKQTTQIPFICVDAVLHSLTLQFCIGLQLPVNIAHDVFSENTNVMMSAYDDDDEDEDLWGIMFTSGSSSNSRLGVRMRRSTLARRIQWMHNTYAQSQNGTCAWTTPPMFVDALWQVVGTLLSSGSTLAILPTHIDRLPELLRGLNVTLLGAVPSILRLLLQSFAYEKQRKIPVNACKLNMIVSSGETLQTSLALKLRHQFPHCTLLNLYGCTEAAGDSCAFEWSAHCSSSKPNCYEWKGALVPVGDAIAGNQVKLVDTGNDGVCEVILLGPQIALGYTCTDHHHHLHHLHHHLHHHSRFDWHESLRAFQTRDIGFIDQWLYISGRISRVVKHRDGKWVSLDSVEQCVSHHSLVRSAAVVLCRHCSSLCVLAATTLLEAELRTWIHAQSQCVIPHHFHITHQSIPLNASGKINYHSVQCAFERNCNGVNEFFSSSTSSISLSNTTLSLQQHIINAMQKIFPSVVIHADSDFVALGGDSLLAIYIAALLEPINAIDILHHRTPRKISSTSQCSPPSTSNTNTHNKPSSIVEDSLVEIKQSIDNQSEAKHKVFSTATNHLHCKWRVDMGKCVDAALIVTNIIGHECVIASSHSGNTKAIAISTGAVVWSQYLSTRIEAKAFVIDDIEVVVICGRNGVVFCLDLVSGVILHQHILSAEPIISCPILFNKQLVVASYDTNLHVLKTSYTESSSSSSSTQYCVGAPVRADLLIFTHNAFVLITLHGLLQIWTYHTHTNALCMLIDSQLSAAVFASPTIIASTCICCTVDGHVYALHVNVCAERITRLWTLALDGPMFARASVLHQQFIVLTGVYRAQWSLLVIDTQYGVVVAQQPLDSCKHIAAPVAVCDGSGVCGVVTSAGRVSVWSYTHTHPSTRNSHTHAESQCSANFNAIAHLQLDDDVYSAPLWACSVSNCLLVGCRDNHVYALNLTAA